MQSPQDMTFIPARQDAIQEAHARPPLTITAPSRLQYIAFRADETAIDAMFDALSIASARSESASDGRPPRYLLSEYKGSTVKLERHTEFASLTLITPIGDDDAQASDDLPRFFDIEAVRIAVFIKIALFRETASMKAALPDDAPLIGGSFFGEMAVRTTLNAGGQDPVIFYLAAPDGSPEETGRRVQRLIEMEQYRTMCLIGLPKARDAARTISKLEEQLETLLATLRAGDMAQKGSSPDDNKALFNDLSRLNGEASALSAATRFRFSASQAYYTLVDQRLETLKEQDTSGLQTLTGFVRARLDPAMATINSTRARQHTLADDLARGLALLRTRMELDVSLVNQQLLQSLDNRQSEQNRISQAVEGLSVVAITYYAVGLVGYVLQGLIETLNIPIAPKVATGLSVPIVFGLVWSALRRVRKKLHAQDEADSEQ